MLQNFATTSAIRSLMLIILSASMLSFAGKPGSDFFTIHLNDRLVLRVFVFEKKGVDEIALPQADADDVLKVRYSHCGKLATQRQLTVIDNLENELRTWQYPDDGSAEMVLKGEQLALLSGRSADGGLRLRYRSSELPEGMVLAVIRIPAGIKARLN